MYARVVAALFLVNVLGVSDALAARQAANEDASISETRDGRVKILSPRFVHVNGDINEISHHSSLDGVCRQFGFDAYVPKSLSKSLTNLLPKAVINKNGDFARRSIVSIHSIGSILCNVSNAPGRIDMIAKNEDGTTTIIGPSFGNDAFARPIDANSNLHGVCKHFGFSESVGGVEVDTASRSIVLNEDGLFSAIDTMKMSIPTLAHVLRRITCR